MTLELLNGLKVLEVGDRLSVSACGKVLADMGAEVIMVEQPGDGSRTRRLPPYYEDVPGPDRSVLHHWLNSNKRSVTLRLEEREGQRLLQRLAQRVDAVITGPGEDSEPGRALEHTSLKEANPKLVIVSISPFGKDGPYAGYRSSDLILFSMSGLGHRLVCPVDDPPSVPPRQNPSYQVALVTGLVAASATLWGFFVGKAKGEGTSVEVSEWDAISHILSEQIASCSEGVPAVERMRQSGTGMTVAGGLLWCLPCSDGWVLISPREDHQFKRWAEVIGEVEWASRPEFATGKLREQRSWEIHERSASWTVTRKKSDVFRTAQAARVPCFPVHLMSDLPQFEQLEHRGFWTKIEHPVVKDFRYPGVPLKTDAGSVESRPAPLLGEDTLEIYRGLGVTAEDLKALWMADVI